MGMKTTAQSPANEGMGVVSEVITQLHDLIQDQFQKAPTELREQATVALTESKKLMSILMEHLKGHDLDVTSTIKSLENKGCFTLAENIRKEL